MSAGPSPGGGLPGGGLLDAGRFADRAEDSWTLPAHWYHDPEVHRLEHGAIFHRSWWYVCHETDLAAPGDYRTDVLVDQPIVLVRGDDGEVRGFHNVCSHRAHPLLDGCGSCRLIVCPYHQWSYGTDGGFRGARGRDALADWIPDNADLEPVRVESLAGMLFANVDPDATPLAELSGAFGDDLRRVCPEVEGLVRVATHEVDVVANWKTILDNNHECYHCRVNHRSLMELVDYDRQAAWSDSGITFTHGVAPLDADNGAYDLTDVDVTQDAMFGFVHPTTIPLCFPGGASLTVFRVMPTGPETSRERWDFFGPPGEPAPAHLRLVDFVRDVLIPEDVGLCESVQRGLHSLGYRQGRFVVDPSEPSWSEHHVHFFQKMVRDALLGAGLEDF